MALGATGSGREGPPDDGGRARPGAHRIDRRRAVVVGAMIGVSSMAAVDTIVFHQLLGWHHFYDRSTSDVALLSDGLLQSAYLALLVGGMFLLADLRRDRAVHVGATWGGVLLGAGAFQLFDGLVDHKVLRVHQIRYGVDDLLPYDLAWNLAAVVLLAVGAGVVWRSGGRRSPAADRQRR